MNEQGEMNGRLPWQNVPGHGTPAQVALHSWHDAGQHGEEAAGGDRGCAIEGERAWSLADPLPRGWLPRVEVGLMVVTRVHARPRVIQFDAPLLRARLPRCARHLIEDLPLDRLVSTQPV